MLKIEHPVLYEDNISLQEEDHLYTLENSEFYPDEVLTSDGDMSIVPLISTTTLLTKTMFPSYFEKSKYIIAKRICNQPIDERKPQYQVEGLTVETIINYWKKMGQKGIQVHKAIEKYLNDKNSEHNLNGKIKGYIDVFLNNINKRRSLDYSFNDDDFDDNNEPVSVFRTELPVYHDLLLISGTIDCVFYDSHSDKYILVDWKTSQSGKITEEKTLNNDNKLVNNDRNKYGCQLFIYKKLFERMTGKKVSHDMYIMNFMSDQNYDLKKIVLKEHEYEKEVNNIFELRAKYLLQNANISARHKLALQEFKNNLIIFL